MYHRSRMSATILIVDDEYAVARGIQYALEQEGYQVTVAGSGEEALAVADELAPDLIVLDVRMPGIDGFETLRRLRGDGSKAPVLMLTARDEEMDKVIGLEMGADDYMTKPYRPARAAAAASRPSFVAPMATSPTPPVGGSSAIGSSSSTSTGGASSGATGASA